MTDLHLQGVVDSFGSEIFSSLTYELQDPSLDGRAGSTSSVDVADDASIIAAFSEIGGKRQPLLGRDQEYRKLKDVWERVSAFDANNGSSSPSEIVAIHGYSGVGKSFLVECFRNTVEVSSEERGIFVSSKFDQLAHKRGSCEPFYAVVSALSDVCKVLFAHMEAAAFLHDLKEVAGVDFPLLVRLIPALSREETKLEDTEVAWKKSSSLFHDDSVIRIRWACRRFLQVASCYTPLLLHFDDIQWADGETLSLIRALLNDKESTSIMFVFSYRDGDESARKAVRKLKLFPSSVPDNGNVKTERSLSSTNPNALPLYVTELKLWNLNRVNVHGMLSTLLNLENPKAEKDLRHVVFVKTQGNPFFVLQFLERLKLEGLLRFRNSERWEWNYLETMMRLNASEDGLLASIDAQVHKLPPCVRSVLVLGAHLGFRFRRDVLETVVMSEYRQVYKEESASSLKARFDSVLETAEKASVLIRVEDGQSFSFVHDRVLQCAYDMVAEGDMKSRLYLNLGQRLLPLLKEDDTLLFLIADVLNTGSDMMASEDGDLKSELVRINKRAAEESMNRAAYRSAIHYLRTSIGLLNLKDSWKAKKKENYKLALELHNQLALATCNCAEYEACQTTTKTILSKVRTSKDKQMARLISIHASTLDGKYKSAVATGRTALKELGADEPALKKLLLRRPKRKVHRVFGLLRTRRSLLSTERAELLSLPKMTDPKKLATLEIMEEMSCARDHVTSSTVTQCSSSIGNTSTIDEINLRKYEFEFVMAYSLKHGWCPSTMPATAAFGLMELSVFDNAKRAAELGDLALEMISCYGAPESKCMVTSVAYAYLFPWTRSWKECVQTLMTNGFSFGIEHGQTYPALRCLAVASGYLKFATNSLSEAEQIIRENHDETKRFRVSTALVPLTKPSWQMILNLKGRNRNTKITDPVMLTGDVMDETKEVREASTNTPLAEALLHLSKLELACHFGALDRAYVLTKMLEENEDYQKIFKTMCPHFVSFTFWSGVTYIDVARARSRGRITPNRGRTLRRAKACRNVLETVVENGCEDARPFYLILKADLASLKLPSTDEQHSLDGMLADSFDAAIDAAVEQGFVGYAGFACERACAALAIRHRSNKGDEPQKSGKKDGLQEFYSKRMFELYGRWGAKAKVNYLNRKFGKTTGS